MTAFRILAALLDEHGLAGSDEQALEHKGFSGAVLTRIVRDDGAAFVLKRMSIHRDWIMRATDDVGCREALLATSGTMLPDVIRTPAVGVARDGEEYALLMHDVTPDLLPQGSITMLQLEAIVDRMAALHRAPLPVANVPWCPIEQRLTLLTPDTAQIAEQYGAPVAKDLADGWRLFGRHATPRAARIIQGLSADVSPLVRALAALPPALLHGDLKLDNVGLDGAGRMWLIDWAMTLIAPPAVEVGWFLAINSRRLPVGLDAAMDMYAQAAQIPASDRPRHDALIAMCGLLLRGWRKALDAEAGEPNELRWWCEHVEAAERYLA